MALLFPLACHPLRLAYTFSLSYLLPSSIIFPEGLIVLTNQPASLFQPHPPSRLPDPSPTTSHISSLSFLLSASFLHPSRYPSLRSSFAAKLIAFFVFVLHHCLLRSPSLSPSARLPRSDCLFVKQCSGHYPVLRRLGTRGGGIRSQWPRETHQTHGDGRGMSQRMSTIERKGWRKWGSNRIEIEWK